MYPETLCNEGLSLEDGSRVWFKSLKGLSGHLEDIYMKLFMLRGLSDQVKTNKLQSRIF